MKKLILLISILSLLTACNRPEKFLEKGKDEKAFNASLQHLQRGKVKLKHLLVFEQAFNNLNDRDAQMVSNLKSQKHPKLWLDIYDLSLSISRRQSKTERISKRVQSKGFYPDLNWYPSDELLEEAEYNVATYYYDEGRKLISEAKNGNRKAAREAHYLFQDCQKYQADFKDAFELEKEMYELGTTHIILEPLETDLEFKLSDQFFNSFFQKQEFPKREEWKVFHLLHPEGVEMDYELAFYFDDLYDGGENVVVDNCTNTETIKVGEKKVKVWSKQDSAYVYETEIIYQDISVSVQTYHQSKEVSLKLFCEVIESKSGDHIDDFTISRRDCWTNEYSIVSGDCRALDISCSDSRGNYCAPPNTIYMWNNLAINFKKRFYKEAKRKIY